MKNGLIVLLAASGVSVGGLCVYEYSQIQEQDKTSTTSSTTKQNITPVVTQDSNLDTLVDVEVEKIKEIRNVIMNINERDYFENTLMFLPKKRQWINLTMFNIREEIKMGKKIYELMVENDSLRLYEVIPDSEVTERVEFGLQQSKEKYSLDEEELRAWNNFLRDEITASVAVPTSLSELEGIGIYNIGFYAIHPNGTFSSYICSTKGIVKISLSEKGKQKLFNKESIMQPLRDAAGKIDMFYTQDIEGVDSKIKKRCETLVKLCQGVLDIEFIPYEEIIR